MVFLAINSVKKSAHFKEIHGLWQDLFAKKWIYLV